MRSELLLPILISIQSNVPKHFVKRKLLLDLGHQFLFVLTNVHNTTFFVKKKSSNCRNQIRKMVFVSREIAAVQDQDIKGAKLTYAPPLSMKSEVVLQHGNQNTMVGLLSQLATLANYAHDIFGGLSTLATDTATRITNLGDQITRIKEAAPTVEKYFETARPEDFLSNPRSDYALPPVASSQLFSSESIPKAVKDIYGKANPPPPLHMMDPVRTGSNKSYLRIFSIWTKEENVLNNTLTHTSSLMNGLLSN